MSDKEIPTLTRKDFVSDLEPRWCPGCGDYAILNTVQKVFAKTGIKREDFAVISGIGCSSRFPYYMNTYGFHTLHGRAPTVATGVKVANPNLSVWLVTGDGDGLSIGGNHMLHVLRKNPDINILLFNNEIYGLTKGQYSPTSVHGKVTKSSPKGSIEQPINPISFALTAEATFVARTMDTNPKHMAAVLEAAHYHKGVAFVEILQNCVIFNDKVHAPVIGRDVIHDNALFLEDGEPLLFGKDKDKGIIFEGSKPVIVDVTEENLADIHVHDVKDENPSYAHALSYLLNPDFPKPLGIFKSIDGKLTFEEQIESQISESIENEGPGDIQKLITGNDFWVVEGDTVERQAVATSNSNDTATEEEKIIKEQHWAERKAANDPYTLAFEKRLEEILGQYGATELLTVSENTKIDEVVQLLKDNNIGAVPVLDKDKKLVGMITEIDILLKGANRIEEFNKIPVTEFMSNSPETLPSWCSVAQALHKLESGSFLHLPVTRENNDLALISIKGILAYLRDSFH